MIYLRLRLTSRCRDVSCTHPSPKPTHNKQNPFPYPLSSSHLLPILLHLFSLSSSPTKIFLLLQRQEVVAGVSIPISLTVGYTRCFSQICNAYTNLLPLKDDMTNLFTQSPAAVESAVKSPYPTAPYTDDATNTISPPTHKLTSISISSVISDPQGIYFFLASTVSCALLAVSLALTLHDLWKVLGVSPLPTSSFRVHTVTAHFASAISYVILTLPVVKFNAGTTWGTSDSSDGEGLSKGY